ncbi:acid-sensing system DNA-binding response regulator EvgA [Rahnella bonaserana]|jgi:two-component system response regulator EvgA|uniref:Acid-sensing system DNA-binding response regulator EvgA n=1 Tax=Rahnella bonaserana TaxID=2816248 RepID=A0ABS6LRW9_9GAMM|nr:acid-sensing system DNA-binding response regulator EvgA [Rahnella bonaserana]MBU9854393.1 acid-sensing system DNA-binding response regulator EvgA [Rahnella bonaserana]
MKAIVIDDHPMARLAIKMLLENSGFSVIKELEDGEFAILTVESTNPDLVVIDIDIPIVNGMEILERLRKRGYEGIIIVVSSKNERFYSRRSSEAGASGFVSKKEGLSNLMGAVTAAQNGYSYFPLFLGQYIGKRSSDEERLDSLSLQEFNVLLYILQGVDNNKIADKMKLSNKTVSTYKKRLLEKLDCNSLIELFAFSKDNNIG